MSAEKTYRAGEQVPNTGLYRVFHYQHRMPHDVVVSQGSLFPPCSKCGNRVMFKLSNSADPLSEDQDFMLDAA
jgi:hypothetical protein